MTDKLKEQIESLKNAHGSTFAPFSLRASETPQEALNREVVTTIIAIYERQQVEIEYLKTKLADLEKQINQSPYNRNPAEYPPVKPPQEPVTI